MTHTHLEIVKIVSCNPFLQIMGIYFKFYGLRWVLLFKYVHYYIRHTVKYILLYDKCKNIKIILYTSFCLKYIMYSYCEVKKKSKLLPTSYKALPGLALPFPLPHSLLFEHHSLSHGWTLPSSFLYQNLHAFWLYLQWFSSSSFHSFFVVVTLADKVYFPEHLIFSIALLFSLGYYYPFRELKNIVNIYLSICSLV